MSDSIRNIESSAVLARNAQSPGRAHFSRLLVVLFVTYLFWLAWQARHAPFVPVDWAFQNAGEVVVWLRGLVRREFVICVLAFILGLLTPPALRASSDPSRRGGAFVWFGWAGFGAGVIFACLAIAWREWPSLGSLLFPWIFCLAGLRLGAAGLCGIRALAWSAVQLGLVLSMLLGGLAVVGRMALEHSPLDFQPNVMTGAEKRLLATRIRATRPKEGEPRHLRLADSEIDALMNAAIGRGGAAHKARFHAKPGRLETDVTLALPSLWANPRFLNVRLAAHLSIENGHLHLDLERFSLGRINAPRLILWVASGTMHAVLMEDPQIRRIVGAIMSLHTEQGAINTVFRPGAIGRQVVPSLVQLLWQRPDVAYETEIYLRHLTRTFDLLRPEEDRFALLMQAAFSLASQRSVEHSPVLENRAAIFALAILLGHEDLEPFVGELFDPGLRVQAQSMMGRVTLRNRQDWPRHFLLSAALKLLSNESMSDRIGLLKERVDSQQGGSGFSFADVLANLAGIRLALVATSNYATAIRLQSHLASGFVVDGFFPPADDLPEGITNAELQTKYGGVNGAGYRQMIQELNRRIDSLPAI